MVSEHLCPFESLPPTSFFGSLSHDALHGHVFIGFEISSLPFQRSSRSTKGGGLSGTWPFHLPWALPTCARFLCLLCGLTCGPVALGHCLLAEPLYLSTGLSCEGYCDLQSGDLGSVGLACGLLQVSEWSTHPVPYADHQFAGPPCLRIGEARHPGPDDVQLLRFGTSNPAGLLRKESYALDLGPGVWAFCETQLSAITQPFCTRNFKRLARSIGRAPTVLHGAPAPVRSSSTWAGAWSGVSVLSDVPAQRLQLSCPSDEYHCGRLLASRHVLSNLVVTVGCVYCYPRGPTWPNASQLNGQLLKVLSGELVYGCAGPRLIMGDMNSDCTDQEAFDVWRRLGWCNLQQFASEHWSWEIQPTSKHSAISDHIWMSPEMVELVRDIGICEIFPDHSTLHLDIEVSSALSACRSWHKPSAVPWDLVDESWQATGCEHLFSSDDPTADYAQFGLAMECSLDGHIVGQPDRRLQPNQRGRCQQTAPSFFDLPPLGPVHPAGVLRCSYALIKSGRPCDIGSTSFGAYKATSTLPKMIVRIQPHLHHVWSCGWQFGRLVVFDVALVAGGRLITCSIHVKLPTTCHWVLQPF